MTQMTEVMTQMTQNCDDNSLMLSPMVASGVDESPPAVVVQPLGRLIPCGSCSLLPVPLMPDQIYHIGRSPKCDVRVVGDENDESTTISLLKNKNHNASSLSANQKKRRDWAFGLISNRHCTIRCCGVTGAVWLEDCSGNGTSITSTTNGGGNVVLLKKGDAHELHSGDEICLLHPNVVQRKIRGVELSDILQRFSYVFIGHTPHHHNANRHHPQQKQSAAAPFAAVRVRDMALSLPSPPPPPRFDRLFPVNARDDNATSCSKAANRAVEPPTTDAPPGTIHGDYVISDVVLGTGTVGEVRRGVHRVTGAAVAVKIMSRAQLDGEAKLLERLSHPYIIRLLHVYYEPHTVYLVMELMERDLFDLLVSNADPPGRFREDTCRYIMRRLLAALHYLHEHAQIVHRDLKPENILVKKTNDGVCDDGHAATYTFKLTDFGLAKEYNSDGKLRTFCGTPQYFAPEVLSRAHTILGMGRYGKPADLYSLGVILHVMLTGCTPQLAAAGGTVLWDPNDDAHVSHAAKALVENLLHPNPAVRLTVVTACDHVWFTTMTNGVDTHCHPLDDPLLPDFQRRVRQPPPLPKPSIKTVPTGTSKDVALLAQKSSTAEPAVDLPEAIHGETIKTPEQLPVSATAALQDESSSPSDDLTLDQLSKQRPQTTTPATAPPPTRAHTVKSSGSSQQHDKDEQRRPLSPFNKKNEPRNKASFSSATPPTMLQNISHDTSSLQRRHKSITPGTPFAFEPEHSTDDEVVSLFTNQTDSIGMFGTTTNEDMEMTEKKATSSPSSKPRRVSEMQQPNNNSTEKPLTPPLPLSIPPTKKRGRGTATANQNITAAAKAKKVAGKKKLATATTQQDKGRQKSLKSFFSPSGK
jgi:serine/threonine protein kinase